MTIVNDETILNDAGSQGDWTAQNFDSSSDNNSSSGTSIYREGTTCQEWILKENITDGHIYDGISSTDFTDKVMVWWFFITSDADLDKLTELWVQISSSSGFTSNYGRWDAKAQIESLDFYGWFPVVTYTTNADETSGTPSYTGVVSFGWTASTGGTGTKLSGFDQALLISYIGGHSQTVTTQNLYDHAITNDHGVILRFGDFYKFQVNIRLGGGTSTTYNRANENIFFDNVQPEHNLGFIGISDSGTNHFELDSCGYTWNEQTGTSPQIFTTPANFDIFRINASTFARGGDFECRSWISDANTYVTNCNIINCDRVDPDTILFTGNTISDTRETADDSGAMLLNNTAHRVSACTFVKGTGASHAIVITVAGTYAFTDLTFTGYNGTNGTTDAVVRNESGGAVTINASGVTGTISYKNGAGASTTVNNNVNVTFSGMRDNSEVRVYDAGDGSEIAGIEDATAGTADDRSFTWSDAAANVVDYVIHNFQPGDEIYQTIRVEGFTVPSSNTTIPIQQQLDRNAQN